jgi:hypothetical protein
MFSMVVHFRQFMVIHDPDNKSVYFRFYDPRVLRTYLPKFDSDQLNLMYGSNIVYFSAEDKEADILHFRQISHGLDVAKTELTKRETGSTAVLL